MMDDRQAGVDGTGVRLRQIVGGKDGLEGVPCIAGDEAAVLVDNLHQGLEDGHQHLRQDFRTLGAVLHQTGGQWRKAGDIGEEDHRRKLARCFATGHAAENEGGHQLVLCGVQCSANASSTSSSMACTGSTVPSRSSAPTARMLPCALPLLLAGGRVGVRRHLRDLASRPTRVVSSGRQVVARHGVVDHQVIERLHGQQVEVFVFAAQPLVECLGIVDRESLQELTAIEPSGFLQEGGAFGCGGREPLRRVQVGGKEDAVHAVRRGEA